MYEIKTEHVFEDFSSDKEMFDFSNYSTKSKYYDDSNKLVIGKMKDETCGGAIEYFFPLKSKMYSLLEDDNGHYKKSKGVNINAVAALINDEYKDELLNNTSLRFFMNRVQIKDHRLGSNDINKILWY